MIIPDHTTYHARQNKNTMFSKILNYIRHMALACQTHVLNYLQYNVYVIQMN